VGSDKWGGTRLVVRQGSEQDWGGRPQAVGDIGFWLAPARAPGERQTFHVGERQPLTPAAIAGAIPAYVRGSSGREGILVSPRASAGGYWLALAQARGDIRTLLAWFEWGGDDKRDAHGGHAGGGGSGDHVCAAG